MISYLQYTNLLTSSSPKWIWNVLYVANTSPSSTNVNGIAPISDTVCSADRAEPSSPIDSNTEATAPSESAQNTRCILGGSSFPLAVNTSMTCEAESDEVTKYVTIPTNAKIDMNVGSGSAYNRANSWCVPLKHESMIVSFDTPFPPGVWAVQVLITSSGSQSENRMVVFVPVGSA